MASRTDRPTLWALSGCLSLLLACGGGDPTGGATDSTGGSTGSPGSTATSGVAPTSGPDSGTTVGMSGAMTSGPDLSTSASTDPTTGEFGTSTTDAPHTSTSIDTTEGSQGESTVGPGCTGIADCFECFACAAGDDGLCATQKADCGNDTGCSDIATCVAGCPPLDDPDFEACYDDCFDKGSNQGVMLFEALGGCLACDTCNCKPGLHPEC